MAVKPTAKANWTNATPANRLEPSNGLKDTGWLPNERPPSRNFNWLQWIFGSWIDYFETVTDQFIGYQAIYSAFVGSGGLATHATITAASAAVASGGRILVLDSATITTPQIISKTRQQVEFQPGVIYTKGGSSLSALQIQADYVKVLGGEFEGFSGGSDAGIRIDSGQDFCNIRGQHFRNCTLGVDDVSGTASVSATTEEV